MNTFEKMRKHIVNELSLNVGEDSFILHPIKGDKVELLQLMSSLEKSKVKESSEKINEFLIKLFERELKPENEQDKKDLELFVYDNSDLLITQLLVGFKLTTQDALDKAKKQVAQSIEEN